MKVVETEREAEREKTGQTTENLCGPTYYLCYKMNLEKQRYAAHLLAVSLEIICPKMKISRIDSHPAGFALVAHFKQGFGLDLAQPIEECMLRLHEQATEVLVMVPPSAVGYLTDRGLSTLAKQAKQTKHQLLYILNIGFTTRLDEAAVNNQCSHFSLLEISIEKEGKGLSKTVQFIGRAFDSLQEKRQWRKQYRQKKDRSFLSQLFANQLISKYAPSDPKQKSLFVWRSQGLMLLRLIKGLIGKALEEEAFEEIGVARICYPESKRLGVDLSKKLGFEAFFSFVESDREEEISVPFTNRLLVFQRFSKEKFIKKVDSHLQLWIKTFKMLGIKVSITLTGHKSSHFAALCGVVEGSGIPFKIEKTGSSAIWMIFLATDVWEREVALFKVCFDDLSDYPLLWGELPSIERVLAQTIESQSNWKKWLLVEKHRKKS